MNCQNCHEIVEPGAAFCGNCGYPVQTPAAASAPMPINAVEPVQVPQTTQTAAAPTVQLPRSEEHTSELQSLRHLVCRLLLETTPSEIYTLSLHDALPISAPMPINAVEPVQVPQTTQTAAAPTVQLP